MTRLAAVLLLAAQIAAPGADSPEAAPTVRRLRFVGVEALPPRELAGRIETAGPRWGGLAFWRPRPRFVPEVLDEDLERIPEIYRAHGYFEASARAELEWDRAQRSVAVTIHVREGDAVRLEAIEIALADPDATPPELARAFAASVDRLPLEEGKVFGSLVYRKARQELLAALAEAGHPAARLEGGARVELERRAARLRWSVDPGPAVRVGEIRITGLEIVARELVTRELRFAEGDAWSPSAQRRSERRLRDTELFRSVAILPRPPEPAQPDANQAVWPVEVRLRERPPRSVRVAVGYGTEDEFRARLAWRHRNFLGGGRKLELAGQYSALLAGGSFRFLQPRLFDPELALELAAKAGLETPPSYDAYRTYSRLELSRPLTGPWSLRGGVAFDLGDVTDAARPLDLGLERVTSLFLGLRRDTLDRPVDPRSGSWLELRAEPAFQSLGSSASHWTLVGEAGAFRSLGPVVLGARLRLGAIDPLLGSSPDDVPVFRRFFAGGSHSLRGYDYQGLGLKQDGRPVGGLSLLEASAELRVPLFWRLSGVVFVDAAQLASAPWSHDPGRMHFGAGPGLRLDTPVGPLRFDLGFPLAAEAGGREPHFYFSVGHAF